MRGDIYDRNGIKLATDKVYSDVYAHPADYDHTPEELAKMLAMDVSTHAKEHVKTPVLELVNIQVVDSYCVNEVVPVFLT